MIYQQHQRQRRNWTPRTPPRNRPRMDYTSGQSDQRRLEENSSNPLSDSDPTQDLFDTPNDDALLDEYYLESIDARHTWEQEQLHEYEGFVVLEQLQLLNNEKEQQENIAAEERLQQTREEERNGQDLLQLEHCDNIGFLLLQMNQPLSYD